MIALTAIKAFLSKHALKIAGGVLVVMIVLFALWQIKESGRAAERVQVLQETIETTNTHVRIEEKQSEIYNRSLSDAELFDSMQHGSF